MINFNFTLNDQDAENLCLILQDNIVKFLTMSLDDTYSQAHKEWFKSHIKYLEEMEVKIISSSKKVP